MPDVCPTHHAPALTRRFGLWLALAALVCLVDQLTKFWIIEHVALDRQRITLTRFFDIVHVLNDGAAFSFLADHSGWQRWFFIVLAIGFSLWLVRLLLQHQQERFLPFAFSLVLGGAIGNVIDRFIHGAVVDFLLFHYHQHYWPAFNVADSAISLGVALLLIHTFTHKPDAPSAAPASEH